MLELHEGATEFESSGTSVRTGGLLEASGLLCGRSSHGTHSLEGRRFVVLLSELSGFKLLDALLFFFFSEGILDGLHPFFCSHVKNGEIV
jgi:hypothetical protein